MPNSLANQCSKSGASGVAIGVGLAPITIGAATLASLAVGGLWLTKKLVKSAL